MNKLIATPDDLSFVATWFEKHIDELPPYPPKSHSELKVQIKSPVTSPSTGQPTQAHIYSFTVKCIRDSLYKIKMYKADGKLDCECLVEYNSPNSKDTHKEDYLLPIMQLFASHLPDDFMKQMNKKDFHIIEESYSGPCTDTRKERMRMTITLYYYIACFFVYFKPDVIHKNTAKKKSSQKVSQGISKEKHTVTEREHCIIFKEYITAAKNGTINHKKHSPFSHAFTVRGCWRHYKDGHKTWVEEFQKGTGITKDKTYKFAKRR